MQFDIHLLNTYYMLNTDSPKMDRAVPPENRYPKMAHRLGCRGSWTDNGTPAQTGGWEGGWGEEYGETASVNSLLLLSTMNLLYIGEGRRWSTAKRHGSYLIPETGNASSRVR